jgi:hypothetical protein
VADGRQLPCQGQGNIQVQFEGEDIQINDVLYVPGLQGNLLSIGQLAERGINCLFSSQGATLRRNGETLAYARREGRNYVLHPTHGTYEVRSTFTNIYGQERLEPDSYELWHRRMGHAERKKMSLLYQSVEGVLELD